MHTLTRKMQRVIVEPLMNKYMHTVTPKMYIIYDTVTPKMYILKWIFRIHT